MKENISRHNEEIVKYLKESAIELIERRYADMAKNPYGIKDSPYKIMMDLADHILLWMH